jgi:hypothetical protein
MKHIKRKFLYAHKLTNDAKQALESARPNPQAQIAENIQGRPIENFVGYITTADDDFIQAFPYSGYGFSGFIPEPHPVVIYFNGAQNYYKHLADSKRELFEELTSLTPDISKQLNAYYSYFSHVTLYTTFLYNSLEAFINHVIPADYEYEKNGEKSTESFNQEQIQRYIPFQEKVKKVIPLITGKSFPAEYGHQYELLLKLKTCRDEIVHTKKFSRSRPTPYKQLFTLALDFDYDGTIHAVKHYINFYEPNLIELCGCGKNH